MNKIFKVVWSKVKHCYVVVSEIAKNTISGGARRSRVRKGALAAALVTTVLGSSFVMPNSAWAAYVNMGNSYEALVVLSATKNDKTGEVAFGVDLYRGDNSEKTGVKYLTDTELETAKRLGLKVYEGYHYTKVTSVGASTEFSTALQQTVINQIISSVENGENVSVTPVDRNQDGVTDEYAISAVDTKLRTNVSAEKDNYEEYEGLDLNNGNLVLTVKDTAGNVITGSANIGEYIRQVAKDATYITNTDGTKVITIGDQITDLTNTVNAGWVAKIDNTIVKEVKPGSNELSFVAGENVTLEKDTVRDGIKISATDTTYTVTPSVPINNKNVVNQWDIVAVGGTNIGTIVDTNTYVTEVKALQVDNKTIGTRYINNNNEKDFVPGFSFIAGDGINLSVDNNAITISSVTGGTGSGSSDLGFTSDDKININVDNENNLVEITANVSGEGYLPTPSGQMFKANAKDGTTDINYKGQLMKLRIGKDEFDVSVITAIESVKDGTPLLRAVQLGDQEYRIVSQDYKLVGAADETDGVTSYTGVYDVINNTVRLNVYDEENGVLGSPVIINGIASKADLDALNFGVIKTTTVTGEATVTTNKLGLVGSDGADFGSVEVTTALGSGGKDATITFGGTNGFSLDVGSTVRANVNVNDLASGAETLTNLRVNGQDYKLFTGSDVAANNNLRVEQGYANKELNSQDKTLHGWVLVDNSQKDGNNPKTYSDTTLKADSATFSPSVTNGKTDDKKVVYGGDYTISDTAGNKVTLEDVASANALKDVADRVTVVENSIEQNIANAKTEVVAGNTNVTIVKTDSGDLDGNGEIDGKETKGHTIYTVSGTDTIKSGEVNVADNGSITLEHVNAEGKANGLSTKIVGLHDYVIDEQTQKVTDGEVTLKVTDKYNSKNTYGVKITDVASASKLKEVETQVSNNSTAIEKNTADITNLRNNNQILSDAISKNANRINQLGNRMNKVGAGSAALAALHPMDFDPDDKLQFSAGVGHYGGENAAALGAFYRPTEKVMFSVAGTMGNGEDMVNAGVTFALDKPNNVSNSRVAMAREIQDLRQQVAALTMLVMQMASRDNAALAGVAMFPDVPENHWAYDYIEGLQKQGIIEGYPDGNFGGDRSMTRYEFAAMLYRALEKGFPVDSRLLNEFNAELGRIRVDRIKGADNDANKVERVRVNNYEDRDDYGSKIVQVKAGA